MATFNADFLFEVSFRFAGIKNIAVNSFGIELTKVVTLKCLENYLKRRVPIEYSKLRIEYESLADFFMDEKYKDIINNKWNIKVMTVNKYNYCLMNHFHYFSSLKLYIPIKETLFVAYFLKKNYMELTESLTKEMKLIYDKIYLPENVYIARRDLQTRINSMLKESFPTICPVVEFNGSSHLRLTHKDSRATMAIRFLNYSTPENTIDLYSEFKRDIGKINNRYHLSKHLKKINMLSVKSIPKAGLYTFIDPISKLNCDLGIDDGAIFQKYELIREYLELDPKIRYLVGVVLHLTRHQKINKSTKLNLHSLKSISYIIMVLHFLMFVLDKPLIPCLHNLPNNCVSKNCLYNQRDTGFYISYYKRLKNVEIRYHTCVHIETKNNNISKENVSRENKPTIWYSDNDDNIGSLLIKFLQYYSQENNFKKVILINPQYEKRNRRSSRFYEQSRIVIKDPFFLEKNIAKNCNSLVLDNILRTFSFAKYLLETGSSLEVVSVD